MSIHIGVYRQVLCADGRATAVVSPDRARLLYAEGRLGREVSCLACCEALRQQIADQRRVA